VAENEKQRFKLIQRSEIIQGDPEEIVDLKDPASYLIRATQGHSIKIESAELLTLLTEETIPQDPIVHGAFFGSWKYIVESGGLNKMQRTHMHFARGLLEDKAVVSGMRADAQLLVWVDARKALEDGFKFWESDNKVVLTEGNEEGMLPLKYFVKVESRKYDIGTIWENGQLVKELPPKLANKEPPHSKSKGMGEKKKKDQKTSKRAPGAIPEQEESMPEASSVGPVPRPAVDVHSRAILRAPRQAKSVPKQLSTNVSNGNETLGTSQVPSGSAIDSITSQLEQVSVSSPKDDSGS
jgi:2'-phosphotransferase